MKIATTATVGTHSVESYVSLILRKKTEKFNCETAMWVLGSKIDWDIESIQHLFDYIKRKIYEK